MGGNQSSAGMAAFSAAVGVVIAYLIERISGEDLPDVIEGAIVTIATGALTFLLPAGTGAPKNGSLRSAVWLLPLMLGLSLTMGCATLGIGGATPETACQRAYAVQGDYNRTAAWLKAYVESPAARDSVREVIQEGDNRAFNAVSRLNEICRTRASPDRDRDAEMYVSVLDLVLEELRGHLAREGALPVNHMAANVAVWLILLEVLSLLRAGVNLLPQDKRRAKRLEDNLVKMITEKRDPNQDELEEMMAESVILHAAIQRAGSKDPPAAGQAPSAEKSGSTQPDKKKG